MSLLLKESTQLLLNHEVEFILIDGWAAALHGATRTTLDVDFVYRRGKENVRRLVMALSSTHPYMRGAPPGLPFHWDERTIRNGLNFTLTTDLGDIDLLGEVTGGGTYEDLLPFAHELNPFDRPFMVVDLDKLIVLKRAAGRGKDLEALAELTALLKMQRGE